MGSKIKKIVDSSKEIIKLSLESAIKFIYDNTKLELKLSEKLELKKLVMKYVDFFEILGGEVGVQSALDFLNENYLFNVFCSEDFHNYRINRRNKKEELGYDYYSFQFKEIQESQFFP